MPVVFRIAKRRYEVYDGTGAAQGGGRWNSPGRAVIYAAEHYATAILEPLVHAGRLALPGSHHARAIYIPDDVAIEQFDVAAHPGWEREESSVARRYGDRWLAEAQSAVLRVPSIPGQPAEWNVLINPAHHESSRIEPLAPVEVVWDGRLFGPPAGSVEL